MRTARARSPAHCERGATGRDCGGGGRARGAQTFALPGTSGEFSVDAPSADAFVSQELIEVLYHTLWETVHVFLEHRERGGDDVGASAFLYPFLGGARQQTAGLV